ncbi:hypothetical protein Ddye_009402 [Dipteronia dyeriana]|uniref:Plastid lipid-associated protein/fibrillin conserved domain-containing protein n=1 Tax=Dipteronia dyeriana TaxID=168575 RepID=A0AAE0CM84_9ROSI|nr:hypothetical protein Ddye_009402 [Dipteronia dyeriana]
MDTNVVKTAIQASQVFPSIPRITLSIKTQRYLAPLASSSYPETKSIRIGEWFRHIHITKAAAEHGHGLDQIKTDFYQAVNGIDRGIFGVPSAKKSEIDDLVKLLESQNPTPHPTSDLKKVDGCWKLVYTSIAMKTKIGLKYFLSLGDIFQTIDIAKKGKTMNSTVFGFRGLNFLKGKLIIEASFKIATKSRVDLSYENSMIYPEQAMNMFRKNYDLVLRMYKREAWFEISYPLKL